MPGYDAPVRDMRFLYHELGDVGRLAQCPDFGEVTPDLVDAILEEAAKFAGEVLQPLNRSGDEEGCELTDGHVRTPIGFKAAYTGFVDNGWGTLTCAADYGGQGLPGTLALMVEEMFSSANMAFAMYPGLTHGAYRALETHGSEELKERYLPRLATCEWGGTMCLTESQCGTDLGLVRTRAEPTEAGSYRISGSKIFISAGDHDLAENIVHLVLARLPDAPEGIRGISLFLVPKFIVNDDATLGPANGVVCSALEHKMGIRASATCAIEFSDAEGFLVGQPNRGMAAMFTMMNSARLGVGVQGLALAEAAYQGAVGYAHERVQGRALKGAKYPDQAADPIIVHPDVRQMLLRMRALTEGARAVAVWVSTELDVSVHHSDANERQAADDLVQLLTPVIKGFFTDIGFEVSNLGVQVFGGHGYIREHGMEQYVRDARITQLYEGTNGVQALDLVGRKLPAHMGRYLRSFFHPVSEFIEREKGADGMDEFVEPLGKAFGRLQRATARIAEQGLNDPDEAGAAASDYLKLFGFVALAFAWARMAKLALAQEPRDDAAFYRAKVRTARYYMQRILPASNGHFAALMAGAASTMEFEDGDF
jgi:alkylation response protein AidB-like acyl-CoA dehydrogenase